MTKLTDLLAHMGDIVAHVLAMADKGMALDQEVLDKARTVEGFIKPLAAALTSSPVTVHLPTGGQQ